MVLVGCLAVLVCCVCVMKCCVVASEAVGGVLQVDKLVGCFVCVFAC